MSSPDDRGRQRETTWHTDGSDAGSAPAANPWGPPPQYQQPQKPRRKRRLLWPALILVALLVVAIGAGALTALQSGFGGPAEQQQTQGGLPEPQNAPQAPVVQADGSSPDWSATAAAVSPSVVSISVESSTAGGEGSGVIYDEQGHVLTNHHVVAPAGTGGTILVTLADKRVFEADIVGTDAATDLAVLSLDGAPGDLRPITPGDDHQLSVGQPVMAIGNPLGLSGTVTTGIVSALNRPVSTTQDAPQGNNPFSGGSGQGELVVTNAIQTSAAINPGNSGGALVDASGQLVGINSSIASLSAQSGNIGIGFAIPVTEAQSVATQLIANGQVAHPYLGVRLNDAVAQEGDIQRRAAGVVGVERGTPAAQAGLQQGDAIIAVDGDTVDSSLSLTAQVRAREVGTETTLTVVRGGERMDVDVTLAQRPSN